ncbi:hypothetical protein NBO_507g0012 [Nosema bombycis CQ1]|uniref:Uncharacterized protein n=1 Tax=Nosema bombycis (strain CQ1 / CVCC 102059) TaxID=578461 RepID=R0KPS9_NOSB1|nr:hypothetical protein NBO_507g0012 [Nosema bombycis CQ1]|eukprot:EOB12197.1 hypothetical protein NBO_507g0012 [Nosema bombycis CQ1]
MSLLSEKIKKYKLTKGSNESKDLYKEILLEIFDNFKNLMNLLRSSIIMNMFLEIEEIEKINFMTPAQVKRLFKTGNLLQYHKLVKGDPKIMKILCNKILIACRLDLFGEGKFIDLYSEIEGKAEEKIEEIIKIPRKRNTVRGGIKKRKKEKRVF